MRQLSFFILAASLTLFSLEARAQKLIGEVSGVRNESVLVKLQSNTNLMGGEVEFFWETPDGDVLPVGEGRVSKVSGDTLTVRLSSGQGKVSVGMRAEVVGRQDRNVAPQPADTKSSAGKLAKKSVAAAGPIETRNVATQITEKRWRWSAFIETDSDTLGMIDCVEYTLHPTFPDPVRKVCNMGSPEQPFALHTSGWGTFRIKIRVFFVDGSNRDLAHDLRF